MDQTTIQWYAKGYVFSVTQIAYGVDDFEYMACIIYSGNKHFFGLYDTFKAFLKDIETSDI